MPMGKGTYGTKKGRPKSAGTKGRVQRRAQQQTSAAKSKIAKSPAKKLGKSVSTLKKTVGVTSKPKKTQGTATNVRKMSQRIFASGTAGTLPSRKKTGQTAGTAGRGKVGRKANKRK